VTDRRPAVFLDKDGTLIEDIPYNVDPDRIRLARGAERLRELVTAGYKLVVVSNQSGLARGYFDEHSLNIATQRLSALLNAIGAPLSGLYVCPHLPDGNVARYRQECDCRKPLPGLIERAARELRLDLGRSWMVGDILNDVEAGQRAGCRTVHIDNGHETEWQLDRFRNADRTVPDLAATVDAILTADSATGTSSGQWAAAREVLCVRLDSLGDVLMTSPSMRALKESCPGRRITLLTSSIGAAAARMLPEVDDVISYDASWMNGQPPNADTIVDELRERRFDAAVLFSVYSQNIWAGALLCQLAGIPLRLGHSRENPYRLLTDWVPEPEPQCFVRHEVRRQLELVEQVGCRATEIGMSLRVSDRSRLQVAERLHSLGFETNQPWVLIHPGSRATSRRYPAESFAALARILSAEDGWQVCFTGDTDEIPLVECIRKQVPARTYSMAGAVDLERLAALTGSAPLLITNNSAPAHIAAAMGTPQVVLYALTNSQHMPWRSPARVLRRDVPCKNCYRSTCPEGHHDCLRLIAPEQVATAAREMMTRWQSGAS
jgi:lipopolysaccharide heptosyltransferase II